MQPESKKKLGGTSEQIEQPGGSAGGWELLKRLDKENILYC